MSKQMTSSASFSEVNSDELRHVFGGMDEIVLSVQLNSNLTSRYEEWVYKLRNLKIVLPDFPRL